MLLLFCPGFSGTAFVLLGTRLLWVPPPLLCALLSRLLWDSILFCLGPGFSGSLPNPCVLLLFCPGFSGTAFVLLGTRLLWVPPPLLCALLSRLLWDSILFCLGPGFSGSLPNPCVLLLFCPGFSGTAFVLLGSRLLWVPPLIVFFYVLLSRLLWDSFSRVLANSSTDFPTNNPTVFSFFSLGNPLSPTFPDKNPKESQIFLARFLLCPFFLLGIRCFSKFLVGKVRTCIYLPPPTILGKVTKHAIYKNCCL